MLPYSPLVHPRASYERHAVQPPEPYCPLCRESFDSLEERRFHSMTTAHKMEAVKLCKDAEYCVCRLCDDYVIDGVSWHLRSRAHVARLPVIFRNIRYYRANPQSLEWHGIRVVTSPGMLWYGIALDAWYSIDWDAVDTYYERMHERFRYFNPGFYDRVAEPALNEFKEEKDEEKQIPPPPYDHSSSSPPIAADVALPAFDAFSPWPNAEVLGGGLPGYAPFDPLPGSPCEEPEYEDDSEDMPDDPPTYQGKP